MELTVIFILVTVAIIAIYDVWVIQVKGKYQSISAYIIRWSKEMPLVTLLIGIVLGHLFWSMNTFDWADKEYLIEKCESVMENRK